jgi:hypothetical protein
MALRAPRRDAGLIIVMVLALVGAPAVGALRNECDLCPPDCPMHQQHDGGHASHLGCHGGGALRARFSARDASTQGPSVSCATCGNHGIMPATVLPPMILPSAQAPSTYAPPRTVQLADAALSSRVVDPPDTPPPIGAA